MFFGRDFGEDRNYSEQIAGRIVREVRQIIDACYAKARDILETNWNKVQRMVEVLRDKETIEADEVRAILNGEPLPVRPVAATPDLSKAAAAPLISPTISPEPA